MHTRIHHQQHPFVGLIARCLLAATVTGLCAATLLMAGVLLLS